MKKNPVRLWLILSLMAMVVIPLGGAYFQVQDVLNSTMDMSSQPELIEALETGQKALRELARKSPQNENLYREQFGSLQNIKLEATDRNLLRQGLLNSFTFYFFASFLAMVLFAFVLALFLSRKVAVAYDKSYNELIQQREKSRFLEEMSLWQDVAKQLTHEIKNPLQPISMWMRNLRTAFLSGSDSIQFKSLLEEASESINQELTQLQRMVDSFTQFSRLPKASFQDTELNHFTQDFLHRYQEAWPIDFQMDSCEQALLISADPNLWRQVFTNLINNACEANPDQRIQIRFKVSKKDCEAQIEVENSGQPIQDSLRDKIFEPHITTKTNGSNFGLGLAIVRKILIDHGGDIRLGASESGAKFVITCPLKGEKNG